VKSGPEVSVGGNEKNKSVESSRGAQAVALGGLGPKFRNRGPGMRTYIALGHQFRPLRPNEPDLGKGLERGVGSRDGSTSANKSDTILESAIRSTYLSDENGGYGYPQSAWGLRGHGKSALVKGGEGSWHDMENGGRSNDAELMGKSSGRERSLKGKGRKNTDCRTRGIKRKISVGEATVEGLTPSQQKSNPGNDGYCEPAKRKRGEVETLGGRLL